jgi:catechol 2,3-dioxygenase-like lactoylglutathione lyase family enzyme
MIQGLSHVTFIVSDLDKMEGILTTVLDAKKVYDSGENTFSLSEEIFFDW